MKDAGFVLTDYVVFVGVYAFGIDSGDGLGQSVGVVSFRTFASTLGLLRSLVAPFLSRRVHILRCLIQFFGGSQSGLFVVFLKQRRTFVLNGSILE